MLKHNFEVGDKVIFIGNSRFLQNGVIYEIHRYDALAIYIKTNRGLIRRKFTEFKHIENNMNATHLVKDISGYIDNKIKILEEQLKTLKDAKLILKGE